MRPELFPSALLLAALLACASPPVEPAPQPPDTPGEDAGVPGPTVPPAQSAKARVRLKRAERLANDFSEALGLSRGELCRELGSYDCVDVVHTLPLGGVEPYDIGIYEPIKEPGVTTPIAMERVALHGCIRRVDRDLSAGASAVIFRGLTVSADGRLADVDAPPVAAALDTLYKRALLRPPTADEVKALVELYRSRAPADATAAARNWMVASCFAVLTTAESLFY